jgi:hypothetical protein
VNDALAWLVLGALGLAIGASYALSARWQRRTWARARADAGSDLGDLSFSSPVRRSRNWWSEIPGVLAFSNGQVTFTPDRDQPLTWHVSELSEASVDLYKVRFRAQGSQLTFELGRRHPKLKWSAPRTNIVASARWDVVFRASGARRPGPRSSALSP